MERFGFSTVTLSGDLQTRLEAARAAGFAATEITSRDLFESLRGVDWTVGVIRSSGLKVSAYQLLRDFEGCPRPARTGKIAVARQIFEQARLVGVDLVILGSNTSDDCSGDRGLIVEDLRTLADAAREHGCRVALEALCWGTHIRDYRDAWAAVREADHPALGIMLDSSHIGALDLPHEPIGQIPGDKIFLVEIADLPKTRLKPIEVSLAYRLFPGEGLLDLPGFVRTVESTGFSGIYSLEVFNSHYRQLDPRTVAARAYRAMQSLWAEAAGG